MKRSSQKDLLCTLDDGSSDRELIIVNELRKQIVYVKFERMSVSYVGPVETSPKLPKTVKNAQICLLAS